MSEAPLRIDPATAPEWALSYRAAEYPPYGYAADVLGLALDPETGGLDALMIERAREPFAGHVAWPGGFVDWKRKRDVTARDAALRELDEETSVAGGRHLQELRTYDTDGRDPRQYSGYEENGTWVNTGVRVVSQAFLGLFRKAECRPKARPGEDAARAFWSSVYLSLPWEDQRSEEGRRLRSQLAALLGRWAASEEDPGERRRQRARIAYAFGTAEEWNEERVAERYALLFEAALVEEAHRDLWGRRGALERPVYGAALAFDHRQMLADALGRLRSQQKYLPSVLAALMPTEFTLTELQRACEAIAGRLLHKQNFRRIVAQSQSFQIVEPTGRTTAVGRWPAVATYHFPKDVAFRRLDPSIRLPWLAP